MLDLAQMMRDLKITMVKLDDIIPYERNNKDHPQEQIDLLVKVISAQGFDVPIVIDENNVIIKGHGRHIALKQLKMTEAPCIVRADLTENEKKAERISDNKISDMATYNLLNLKLEYEDLKLGNYDLGSIGVFQKELDKLDKDFNKEAGNAQSEDYTKKIVPPIYEPKLEKKPEIKELFDTSKADELIKEVEASNLSPEEKTFLRFAAYRHIVFNYENIAEYYSHSEKETQNLIENSAMVIIDFNKAIEKGFVALSQEIAAAYQNDHKDNKQ